MLAVWIVTVTGFFKEKSVRILGLICFTSSLRSNSLTCTVAWSGNKPTGRKVKGTIHWVSSNSIDAEVRLYHPLLLDSESEDFLSQLNPQSLEVLKNCKLEKSLLHAKGGDRFQFERQGYFFADPIDSKEGKPVFNRIVTLKDSWSKKK